MDCLTLTEIVLKSLFSTNGPWVVVITIKGVSYIIPIFLISFDNDPLLLRISKLKPRDESFAEMSKTEHF